MKKIQVIEDMFTVLKNTHRLYNLDHETYIEFDVFVEFVLIRGLLNIGEEKFGKLNQGEE